MMSDINKSLCELYPGINPLNILNYPAEDVFDLIKSTSKRENKKTKKSNAVRKKAGDDWF